MNTKSVVRGVFGAVVMAAAMASQATVAIDNVGGRGPVLNGPLLQGISLNGPILQGISLNGPILQGISLNGPLLQGTSLQGSIAPSGRAYYGLGRGVFAIPPQATTPVVPGHSQLSGIASSNVQVRLAN